MELQWMELQLQHTLDNVLACPSTFLLSTHLDIGEANVLPFVGFKSTLSMCRLRFCASLFKMSNIKIKKVTAVHSTYNFKKSCLKNIAVITQQQANHQGENSGVLI